MTNDRKSTFISYPFTYKGRKSIDMSQHIEWRNFYIESKDETGIIGHAVIPNGLEHRPDLISFYAYGTPDFYWAILAANDVLDPEDELNAGDKIVIPRV